MDKIYKTGIKNKGFTLSPKMYVIINISAVLIA